MYSTCTRPRSGLGLNELLDRCQPLLLTNHLTPPESSADNRSSRTSRTQKRSAGVLAGTEFVAKIKARQCEGRTNANLA
jgi:hypothetical protein